MRLYRTTLLCLTFIFLLAITTDASVQLGLDWRVAEKVAPGALKLNWWINPEWGVRSVYLWEEEDLGLSIAYVPNEKGNYHSYLAVGIRDLFGISHLPIEEKIQLTAGFEFRLDMLIEGLSTAMECRVVPSNLVGEQNRLAPFFGFSLHYGKKQRLDLNLPPDGDLYLLAKLIRAEAEGESYRGQVAVGAVVMNRVKSPIFPNTIREVIYQSGQFSCLPKLATMEPTTLSLQAAKDALRGKDPSHGALYYYNPRLSSPEGLRFFATANLQRTVRIGNHIFFR